LAKCTGQPCLASRPAKPASGRRAACTEVPTSGNPTSVGHHFPLKATPVLKRSKDPGRGPRKRDAFRGVPPPRAGDPRGGFRFCGIRLAGPRKRTESVSPPSSPPDRPSPKRLSGGRAFNLRRSVLGALGKLLAHFDNVKSL
jgi:hypothetical protein